MYTPCIQSHELGDDHFHNPCFDYILADVHLPMAVEYARYLYQENAHNFIRNPDDRVRLSFSDLSK